MSDKKVIMKVRNLTKEFKIRSRKLGEKPITVRDWIKKDTGIPAHKIGKKCTSWDGCNR